MREIQFAGLMLLLAVLALLAGCDRPTAANIPTPAVPIEPAMLTATRDINSSPVESHDRMVAELERIREQSLIDNPFFQVQSARDQERQLKQLAVTASPAERFVLHTQLMDDYRRLGQMKDAVKHLEAARQIDESTDLGLTPTHRANFYYELGLTSLRRAETENCLHCRTGESCIVPIRAGGVHRQRRGSEQAVEDFLKALEYDPTHLQARWLLNIAAMTLGEFPQRVPERYRLPETVFQPTGAFPRFHDVADAVGLKTVNCGGGVVADDFDNDGLIDILTSSWDPAGQLRFFRNTGNGQFVDQSADAGLTGLYGGINLVQADYDNDGLLDVFVMRGAWLADAGQHPDSLLRNLGEGKFRDVTFDVGLADIRHPTSSAAWSDFDNDGDLDLYVGHEAPYSQLYRNDGMSGFTNVTETAGVINGRFTKGVTWGDYNNDRLPDLYVSNLYGENRLYRNDGNGQFTDVAPDLGLTAPYGSFGTWFWDVNNDGLQDLFVASYNVGVQHVAADHFALARSDEPDSLYLGQPNGTFREAAAAWGLKRVTQPMGCNFGDLDNDGFPDFYLGTGYPGFEGLMPNQMYRNRAGKSFTDVTFAGGFGHLQKGHGIAFADLDNDGDQDVFSQTGGAYPGDRFGDVVYENPGFGHHFLRIKLVGVHSNRSAIGARIRADVTEDGQKRSIYRWVNSGGSFGANPLQQQLGLGPAQVIDRLEIYWPTTDITQVFEKVPAGGALEIREHERHYRVIEMPPAPFARTSAAGPAVSRKSGT